MMTNKNVRIVKRSQKSLENKDVEPSPQGRNNDSDRELKETVSAWVREFRQQQRQSFGKQAFNSLFNAA